MRPRTLEEYVGQTHIVGEGLPLRRALDSGRLHSMLLWGPPGTGKTTLAELMAEHCHLSFIRLSAIHSGVKEIRAALQQADYADCVIFVDEVHRFNKAQQDAFLPAIESGKVVFIGATTENPSFSCNNALLSRCRVYILESLGNDHIAALVSRALQHDPELAPRQLTISDEALSALQHLVSGDARKALLYVELASQMLSDSACIEGTHIAAAAGQQVAAFDKDGDYYYDLLSAFHKSVRGSSSDGALYWMARFIEANTDITPILRRLLAIASEDIGLADPKALNLCLTAWETYHRVGAAEGERAVAQACVYCALAPKSNALYSAFKQAKQAAKASANAPVPNHLRNAPTALAKSQGHGAEYRYSHNEPHAYSAGQCYLPEGVAGDFYHPHGRGLEIKLAQKKAFLAELEAEGKRR
jgi:putative ATPase